jgi:hypothetical protein
MTTRILDCMLMSQSHRDFYANAPVPLTYLLKKLARLTFFFHIGHSLFMSTSDQVYFFFHFASE